MKKRIFSLFIFFVYLSFLFGMQLQEINDAYINKQYEKALSGYLSMPKNADIYYNIANCYYKLDDLGRAVLYYKRALKIDINNNQYQKNLLIVQSLLKDKSSRPTNFESMIKKIDGLFSLNVLAIILLVLFIATLVLGIASIFKYYYGYLALFLLLVMTGFASFSYHKYSKISSNGVLLVGSSDGFSGPSKEYTKVFTIHTGNIFKILEYKDLWCKIELQGGLVAWIEIRGLEKI